MEAPFGGPLQTALIERTFLEGPLFVHSSANKGPLCGGLFMGSTYRGPIFGGRMKRAPLRKPYEEDLFEIMRGLLDSLLAKGSFRLWKRFNAGRLLEEGPFVEGPVWMFFLQGTP